MLSLEERFYLLQCWTGFRHIIITFYEKFSNTYISRMQKLIKKFLKIESVTNLQKMLSEDLHNGAEGLRQRIRNVVALLTIEEIRNT
jgi:hypothetical protein